MHSLGGETTYLGQSDSRLYVSDYYALCYDELALTIIGYELGSQNVFDDHHIQVWNTSE